MKGLTIFSHSLRQVTGNLEGALKVSALPYAAQFLASLALLGPAAMAGQADPAAAFSAEGGPSIVLVLLNLVITLVASIWIAVAWHRYILKNEAPTGFVPIFNGNRIFAYFLRSLGIAVLFIVLAIPLGIVAALIAAPFFSITGPNVVGMLIIMVITYVPLAVLAYRLSTSLPAMALDEGGSFLAGWEATKGENGAIAVLAVVSVLLVFAGSAIGIFVLGKVLVLALAWAFAFNWLVMMVGVSILTTLYGHYIEKRALT